MADLGVIGDGERPDGSHPALTVSGTMLDAQGQPARRHVRLARRADGSIVREGGSSQWNGTYELATTLDDEAAGTTLYAVAFDEDGGTNNALILDKIANP